MKTGLAAALLTLLISSPASAQWSVEVAAGGTNHAQVAASGTLSAIVGLQYQEGRWGYLTAGAPLDSASLPWLVGGVGQRLERPAGSFDVGADLAAHAHAYRTRAIVENGSGFVLELIPFAGRNVGPARVELASGVRYYSNSFAGETESRAISDTKLRASGFASPNVLLGLQGRYAYSEDGSFPFLGAGLDVSAGNAIFSAHAGRWVGDLLDEAVWGARATFEVGRRTSVIVSLDREAPDPLFWNPARKSWGLGVTYGFGRPSISRRVVEVQPRGPVQFTVRVSEASGPVSIAGDFNGWEPVRMELSGDSWTFTLPLEPGVYHYAFVSGDGSWFLPSATVARVDDGFGGESAVVIVGADASQ